MGIVSAFIRLTIIIRAMPPVKLGNQTAGERAGGKERFVHKGISNSAISVPSLITFIWVIRKPHFVYSFIRYSLS